MLDKEVDGDHHNQGALGDGESKGGRAEEDVADEERAKLSHQMNAVACFEDTVGLVDLC